MHRQEWRQQSALHQQPVVHHVREPSPPRPPDHAVVRPCIQREKWRQRPYVYQCFSRSRQNPCNRYVPWLNEFHNRCDEKHGSWGQYGTEWACKSWLSGGKLITTKKTWFGHMFRTGNFRGSPDRCSAHPRVSEEPTCQVGDRRKVTVDLRPRSYWKAAGSQ